MDSRGYQYPSESGHTTKGPLFFPDCPSLLGNDDSIDPLFFPDCPSLLGNDDPISSHVIYFKRCILHGLLYGLFFFFLKKSFQFNQIKTGMAEREGFEPSMQFLTACSLSRGVT